MKKVIIAITIGVLALGTIVRAEEPEKYTLAEQLLVNMNMQKTIEESFGMVKQMMSSQMMQLEGVGESASGKARESVQTAMDLVMKEMSWDKLKDDYISIYAETFSADELKGLVEFYESPVGKKLIEKQPELMQRSMQMSQKQMKAIMPRIQALKKQLRQQSDDMPEK